MRAELTNAVSMEDMLMAKYGDDSAAPPKLCRDMVELQRACCRIAAGLRRKIPEGLATNFEADITETFARLVIHYTASPWRQRDINTIEFDFQIGLPLEDSWWISQQIDLLLKMIKEGISDIVIGRTLDYLRLIDDDDQTIYEDGGAIEWQRIEKD